MNKEIWSLQDLATKIDSEGLDYSILNYFGPNLPTDNRELLKAWKQAYKALQIIKDILPEPEYE